jgi:hypothetical protein
MAITVARVGGVGIDLVGGGIARLRFPLIKLRLCGGSIHDPVVDAG